jgi:Putative glucoamylase/Protein of unknown function (DUF3131)
MAITVPSPAADLLPRGRRELERYARATWHSFEKLVVASTGLPGDSIGGELRPETRAAFTSPTNIAMYLWATLAARDLELISSASAESRIRRALESLAGLERHEPSGQFYNWYDPGTLEKLTIWPEAPGGVVYPFISSVDNGWLASALLMVANAVPALRDEAWRLVTSMDFAAYYDALAKGVGSGPGLLRGGFWREGEAPPGSNDFPRGDYSGMGETVVYTGHHYGTFNTEPRIASYIGIALGQLPPEHYFAAWRTYPDTCEFSWQESKPVGAWRTYFGVQVFEGAYAYRDRRVVPTWGGSMFEALMPALVVPEERWGAKSWAVTHPLYVEAQIEFGLEEAGYGYWGFSPASDPAGGYREYGVDALGMEPNGYAADAERLTLVDAGWEGDGCSRPPVPIEDYGEGVVTPHAAFLALDFAPEAALANLAALRQRFPDVYGVGGFKDTVNVATGQIADRYLALDQGMVMAAVANALQGDRLQGYLAVTLQPSLEPLMAMEEFAAGRGAR